MNRRYGERIFVIVTGGVLNVGEIKEIKEREMGAGRENRGSKQGDEIQSTGVGCLGRTGLWEMRLLSRSGRQIGPDVGK